MASALPKNDSRSMPGGVVAFVLLFAFSLLVGLSAVPGLDNPPWQDILLDEDEKDPLESKLSLAVPDGQPALSGSCDALGPCGSFRPLAASTAGPPIRGAASAPASPRAPPAA